MRRLFLVALMMFASFSRADGLAPDAAAHRRADDFLRAKAEEKVAGIAELQETSAETDAYQNSHFRYTQVHDGIPVLGSYAKVHVLSNGEVFGYFKTFAIASLVTTPAVKLPEARRAAGRYFGLTAPFVTAEEQLVIVPRTSLADGIPAQDTLCWAFRISSEEDDDSLVSHHVIVDAQSGAVLFARKDIKAAAPMVDSPMDMRNAYNRFSREVVPSTRCKSKKCQDWLYDTAYIQDVCFGIGKMVKPIVADYSGYNWYICPNGPADADGFVSVYPGGNYICDMTSTKKCSVFTRSMRQPNVMGDAVPGSSNPETAVADAFFALRRNFEFLYTEFNRLGLDGKNGPRIRIQTNDANEFGTHWDAQYRRIRVAPGDETTYGYGSFDVIAHEIGHALDTYGPNMVATTTDSETPGVEEATADMYAMLASAHNESTGKAWWIVEHPLKLNWSGQTFLDVLAVRYLNNPTLGHDPFGNAYSACYSAGIGSEEQHRAGAPGGHMFYLLTYGGTSACNGAYVGGLGVEMAGKLWYQMFFTYLLPDATYETMKDAFLNAAFDLDGKQVNGPVFQAVKAAFAAIGM